MKKIIKLLFICLASISGFSQRGKKAKDIESIKSMCGCYNVKFNFKETFNYSDDSLYVPSKVKQVEALEYAFVIEGEDKDKIQIQHLLLISTDSMSPPMVMKHWRQDWLFENRNLYTYDKDLKWVYKKLPKRSVKGQWTQKVYQVDDSPRYEGSATWVHVDGRSFWENTTSAPLPRREASQRLDYNVTLRRNRHEILANAWLHDQYNDKLVRADSAKDFVLAQEKGFNQYTRVDVKKCNEAIVWWAKNKKYWANVRSVWDNVYHKRKDISLHNKVDGKKLYSHLFGMDVQKTKKRKIRKLINKYIKK